MDVTLKEAIQLILDFRYVPVGYWKDIPIEDPLVCQFIKEGYAALDPEYQEKYVLSVHSAAPNGSWCGDQRQLSAANGTLN